MSKPKRNSYISIENSPIRCKEDKITVQPFNLEFGVGVVEHFEGGKVADPVYVYVTKHGKYHVTSNPNDCCDTDRFYLGRIK